MYTIKLYTNSGHIRIHPASDFQIHRHSADKGFEVTAHQENPSDDIRFDIGETGCEPQGGTYDYGFIVNESGNTVESLRPRPS